MNEIYAKIIADSISPEGHRLTTMEVRFNRFVLAEVNTHRKFSRNSASSRAIPLRKMVERATAEPVSWPAEQKGMQGGDEISNIEDARETWLDAAADARTHAVELGRIGVHKSVANRVLEPYLMHTAVISATDYDGFWEQRCSPLAQPEIRVAAEAMKAAYDASTPSEIQPGMWHLPYITDEDREWAAYKNPDRVLGKSADPTLVKMSAARCARVSYLTQDGRRDPAEDFILYDRLVAARPPHWSPLEHPATPWRANVNMAALSFPGLDGIWTDANIRNPHVGNFLGWRQHRFEMEVAA